MKERFQRFMVGRYGVDAFSRFLNIIALVLLVLGIITVPQLSTLGVAVIVYNYYRIFSRKVYARAGENTAFLRQKNRVMGYIAGIKQRFSQRKTHCFFKCSSCKKTVRVPKGKGKIEVTCPVCHNQFIRRT